MNCEIYGRMSLQIEENIEHGIGVFAPGQTYHYQIAVLDHIVVGDSAPNISAQILTATI